MDEIIIVSGLPRSGTSMIMKMLEAGGVELLTDNRRKADSNNPKGYFEYEKVKDLKNDSSWLGNARGKTIKIISMLLYYLPPSYRYKVLFLKRNINEIIASQNKMLKQSGQDVSKTDDKLIIDKFTNHLEKVVLWVNQQQNMESFFLKYDEIIKDPISNANRIVQFIEKDLPVESMAKAVDPSLYRNRYGN